MADGSSHLAPTNSAGPLRSWQWEESRRQGSGEVDGGGRVEVTVLADQVVRVRFNGSGRFHENASWPLATDPGAIWPAAQTQVRETEAYFGIHTPQLAVIVGKSPLRLSFYDSRGGLLSQDDPAWGMAADGRRVELWRRRLEGEAFLGLGEKTGPLNRDGRSWTNWCTDVWPHLPDTDPMYQAIPFLLGWRPGRVWGLYWHNTFRSYFLLDDSGGPGRWGVAAEGGDLDYFFFAGSELSDVLRLYTDLTGRMPLPPAWALDYQQSAWSYTPQRRAEEIVEEFQHRRIPLGAVYLDIDYMDGFRVFTWGKDFPDPQRLAQKVHAAGGRLVTILDPGVKVDPPEEAAEPAEDGGDRQGGKACGQAAAAYEVYTQGVAEDHFVHAADGSLATGVVWPGEAAFPDFVRPQTREFWARWVQRFVQVGVDGIWNDMNEPSVMQEGKAGTLPLTAKHGPDEAGRSYAHAEVHNAYALLMAQATQKGLLQAHPDRRPFILTRAGFAGIQRYAAVWTGDNHAWWEHLAMAVPMLLGLGLSGVPFVGTDIGGFMGNCNGELLARWTQFGVFSPLCRNHRAIGTRDQEPWAFGPQVEAIARAYIRLRRRLFPYLYSLFWEAAQTGAPVLRPLLWHAPGPESIAAAGNREAFLGPALLVAPVTQPAADTWPIWFPAGRWVHAFDGQVYQGPSEQIVPAPLEQMPLFVRAGSVLPLSPWESAPDAGGPAADGAGGECRLAAWFWQPQDLQSREAAQGLVWYRDAGEGFAYREGAYCLIRAIPGCNSNGLTLQVQAEPGSQGGAFLPRQWRLSLEAMPRRPAAVYVDGQLAREIPAAAFRPSANAAADGGDGPVWGMEEGGPGPLAEPLAAEGLLPASGKSPRVWVRWASAGRRSWEIRWEWA